MGFSPLRNTHSTQDSTGLFCTIALWMVVFPLCTAALGSENKKEMFISGIENEQTHAMAKEVLREAYGRLGLKVRFGMFPGQRSIAMANSGESDGDIARIQDTDKKYTNLIPVPTPVINFDGVVFTKEENKNIHKWKDLDGLRIGVIRGIRYSEIGTRGLSPFLADDMTHLFRLLEHGRIDVGVAVLRAGKIEIAKNFSKSAIHVISGPLYSGPLFHYVHRKNREIVPRLDLVLQEMQRQNEIEKIINTSYKQLLQQ